MTHPAPEARSFLPSSRADAAYSDAGWADETESWEAVAPSALVHRVRWHTGLSQAEFAAAFAIDPEHLRALERGAAQPDSVLVAYLTVIDRAPELVRSALRTY